MCVFLIADDNFEFSVQQPLFEIFRGEQSGGGALNRTEFHQRKREDPPFGNTGQHDEYAVAFGDSVFEQQVCRLIGEAAEIKISKFPFASLLIDPDHRKTIAFLFRPFINNIIGKIVIFRYFNSVFPQLCNGRQIFFRKLVHFPILYSCFR